jgi:HK97 family phage portal protein
VGLFSPLFERRRTSTLANPEQWFTDALSSQPTTTGITVSETNALGNAGVYACVRVLSETVAQLPLKVYRKLATGGKEPDETHALYALLHDLPNPEMTAYEFKQAMQGHLSLWGNAYAEIERDALGRIKALWPLRPDCMDVLRDKGTRVWLYRVPGGQDVKFTWANPSKSPSPILHLRALSGDGFLGYAPLRLMRESLGLTLAAEEYGARLFANGTQPRGVLTVPQTLSDAARDRLKKAWDATHRGLGNSNRVAVLEGGVAWQQVGMNPDDAQFLETRKFQLNEIARMFRVPPHMIGDLERATFSNIEHQSIDFVVHSLMPWLVCWEQACARDLLSVKGFNTHQIRFVVQSLLRGDIQSRYQAYAVGRQWGWLSADDIRALEDMNPIEDGSGSTYLTPMNMTPADKVDALVDAQIQAQSAPASSGGQA